MHCGHLLWRAETGRQQEEFVWVKVWESTAPSRPQLFMALDIATSPCFWDHNTNTIDQNVQPQTFLLPSTGTSVHICCGGCITRDPQQLCSQSSANFKQHSATVRFTCAAGFEWNHLSYFTKHILDPASFHCANTWWHVQGVSCHHHMADGMNCYFNLIQY